MVRVITVLFVVAVISPPLARADSDGYYCVGRGYIAYETRFSTQPSQHLLHVIQFSSTQGIVRIAPIALENFQVHSMTCHATAIELTGWTTRYLVDISDVQRPAITSGPKPGGPGPGEAGRLNRLGVIDLQGDARPGEFQLVIAGVSRPYKGGVTHYRLSQLIQWDPRGRILASHNVFTGIFVETAD